MPWCPRCGCEFHDGVQSCNTCGLPLLDHMPTEEERQAAALPGDRRFWNRQRLLLILRALVMVLLALAAALVLAGR